MLLIAGGQLDVNIGRLLRRVLARGIPFKELLVGPALSPGLSYGLDGPLHIDGVAYEPSACFVRHDVFLAQRTKAEVDQRRALNWFHAIKGWAMSRPDVRLLNRNIRRADQGKVETLQKARQHGLAVPETTVATAFAGAGAAFAIRKPVAGGELTEMAGEEGAVFEYPYLLQPRLARPELRLFRIGPELIAFSVESPDLDYRRHQNVEVTQAAVPPELAGPFVALCDDLGLDFAAGDFMLGAGGEWRFLEVNSQPMYAGFDRAADGRLCDAIVSWLAG